MRKEYREYNFDAMVTSMFNIGAHIKDGTDKECHGLLKYAPHFKEVLGDLLGAGEPGILFIKMVAKFCTEIATAHERGKKIALGTFTLPPSVMRPFGVIPMWVEPITCLGVMMWARGVTEYLNHCCELGFTETACTGQRGALGATLAGLTVKPDFAICNCVGACDSNATAFNYATEYLDIPFYQLNALPDLIDERTAAYHREDFRGMVAFVEEQTGKKMDLDVLREVLLETDKQDQMMGELQELMRLKPSPVPGIFNFLMYAMRFIYAGSPEGTELLECMLRIAKQNLAQGRAGTSSGREDARVMAIYIDHYAGQLKPWTFYDAKNISYLGGALDYMWHGHAPYVAGLEQGAYRIDTSSVDAMFDSMADQMSRMPMVKQLRGPYDNPHMWRSDTMAMIKTYKPDFCTFTSTIGCRNTWSAIKMLSRDVEKAGIPALVLFGDSFDDRIVSWESMQDRIDEFIQVRGILR